MKNRGEIDSQVGTLKQTVKDLSAKMNSIKHFEQDHSAALLDLYLGKPSQDWVKKLETTILEDRGLAAAETLVCIQELLDTTANQVNFARTLRLERSGLKAALQTTLDDQANSKTLQSVHFKDDYSALLGTLIEAPLSDENLVREFTVYDTLREIVGFFAAVPHWRAANYAEMKMKLEKRISEWEAEDLLKQDGVAFSVLQKFLSYRLEDTNTQLGKRKEQVQHAEHEISKSGLVCSLSESPATKGKGQSNSQLQSTKNLQCGSILKSLGFEACYPDGSFLTDKTDDDFYRERLTPVVKEPMKANKAQNAINQLVEDFIDGTQQGFGVGWSGLKTTDGLGSHPHSKMQLKTSSNTCKHFGKERETQRTIKSGMSSQHLSRSSKDGYARVEMAACQKFGIQPTKLEMGLPHRQEPSLPRRGITGVDRMRDSSQDSVSLSRAQQPFTIQDAVSKQLTNLNYSEVHQKLQSQDNLHQQQKMLQVLVLGSFDQSRQEAKETLYQALRKEFGDAQARFQAKKLESDIFGLYYNDLQVYQDKVAKCAATLQQMFKKDWPSDHLMATCIDYDLLAAIQTHVHNIVRGGPSFAEENNMDTEDNHAEHVMTGPRISPFGHANVPDVPCKPEVGQNADFVAGEMILEHHGLTREEVFGHSQKDNSCVEVSRGMAQSTERKTPWNPKLANLNDNLRSTAETDRRGGPSLLLATEGPQKPALLRQGSFDLLTDPFAEDDLDLSTNSFEFLECIAKVKEAEISLLNQHLSSVMHENELLREALMHVKANMALLESIDCEADGQVGDLMLPNRSLGHQLAAGEETQLFDQHGPSNNGLRASPRGEP